METRNQHIKDFDNIWIYSLLLGPFGLFALNGFQWKESVSAFAEMPVGNQFLGMYLFGVGLTFLGDWGGNRERWWNLISALSIWGVASFTMYDHQVLHYCFAGLFFATTNVTMITRVDKGTKERKIRWWISGISTLILVLSVSTSLMTILVGEWIGIVPMAVLLAGGKNNKTYLEKLLT
jgi:hypothetical protein